MCLRNVLATNNIYKTREATGIHTERGGEGGSITIEYRKGKAEENENENKNKNTNKR